MHYHVPLDDAFRASEGWFVAERMSPGDDDNPEQMSLGAFSLLMMTGFFWLGVLCGALGHALF